MKKLFYIFLILIFVITLGAVGCSKKPNERPPKPPVFNVKSIYGAWVKVKDTAVTIVFTRGKKFTTTEKDNRCEDKDDFKGSFEVKNETIEGKEQEVVYIETSCAGSQRSIISYIRTINDDQMTLKEYNSTCKKDCSISYKKVYDL